jgi:tRNA(Ile)-lysidine synthase
MVEKLFDPADLANILKTETPYQRFCVAYSGGLDSAVLLHSLAVLQKQYPNWSLRALHVHHGLNTKADFWQKHCETVCQTLGVPIETLAIRCVLSPGDSLEAVAREQRYAALFNHLAADEVLLTAHHADDQAETLLLQLLRGAGVAGLAAMPLSRWQNERLLLRPFLSYSRASLLAYAKKASLSWVDDDSNLNTAFDRNYLRHEVMPKLKARWPAVVANLQRSSQHCASALGVLKAQAQSDLAIARVSRDVLSIQALLAFGIERQIECVRAWLRDCGLQAPSQKRLTHLFEQVIGARADASPQLRLGTHEIRRYRDCLYLIKHGNFSKDIKKIQETPWGLHEPLTHDYGIASVSWEQGRGLRYESGSADYSLCFGKGGDKLKKIFQAAGIPPWERPKQPLLFYKSELLAVSNYWVNKHYWVKADELGFQLVWKPLL